MVASVFILLTSQLHDLVGDSGQHSGAVTDPAAAGHTFSSRRRKAQKLTVDAHTSTKVAVSWSDAHPATPIPVAIDNLTPVASYCSTPHSWYAL